MQINYRKIFVLAALWIVATSASAISGKVVAGVVLDKTSGKPIPGAIVIASWSGHRASLAHGESVCYHVETARADATGAYRIPAWTEEFSWRTARISSRMLSVAAFQPGYVEPAGAYSAGGPVYLVPQGPVDYLAYLDACSKRSMCPGARTSRHNLYRLFDALVAQANLVAVTPAQRRIAGHMAQARDEYLVNMSKPIKITGKGMINVNPADSYHKEDLLK